MLSGVDHFSFYYSRSSAIPTLHRGIMLMATNSLNRAFLYVSRVRFFYWQKCVHVMIAPYFTIFILILLEQNAIPHLFSTLWKFCIRMLPCDWAAFVYFLINTDWKIAITLIERLSKDLLLFMQMWPTAPSRLLYFIRIILPASVYFTSNFSFSSFFFFFLSQLHSSSLHRIHFLCKRNCDHDTW